MTFDDVAELALQLPEAGEAERRGTRIWMVGAKTFAWERPFSKADLRRFGDTPPPPGPILALRVADLMDKEAVLAAHPEAFFTIPHFEGFTAILVQLDLATREDLGEAIVDAWLACAPPRLAETYQGL
ncbi:MAG TPA: hypothetical protein VFW71_11615 [Actinomycetota bacterium]|nr:hypothetical protein [Actinomycetota bacterium]